VAIFCEFRANHVEAVVYPYAPLEATVKFVLWLT
jgi:hypothetical protein